MKIANPLHYPLAVFVGGLVLFVSVRLVKVPSFVMVPVSCAITTVGATVLKQKESTKIFVNPALEQELRLIRNSAQTLATKAESLRQEAEKLLTVNSEQIELLTAVQYGCDRASELPEKINQLASRFQGEESLLSVQELRQQLSSAQAKLQGSSRESYQQLKQLIQSLQNNIKLAQQGQDARQAQLISLSTLITDSAGTLQRLQNQLRTSDLNDAQQIFELRSLSEELKSFQENVDLLIS